MKTLTVNLRRSELTLGLIYIFLQIFVLPLILEFVNSILTRPLSNAALHFVCFAINFICVTVIFHRFLIDSFHVLLKHPTQVITVCLLGFLLYWLSSMLVNALILYLDPMFSNVNNDNISVLINQNYDLMAVGTMILIPVVEETLYRGVIFSQLYRKNKVLGYIISATFFSALHILGYISYYSPHRLLFCFFQYIPAGIFLAWAYVKADTIFAPILIHTAINLIGMLAM